jgi:hypothetical protein
MGSKSTFDTVDDSVHVMLQHDKKIAKNKGQQPSGYVPRAEHPLLQQPKKQVVACEDDDEGETTPPPQEETKTPEAE